MKETPHPKSRFLLIMISLTRLLNPPLQLIKTLQLVFLTIWKIKIKTSLTLEDKILLTPNMNLAQVICKVELLWKSSKTTEIHFLLILLVSKELKKTHMEAEQFLESQVDRLYQVIQLHLQLLRPRRKLLIKKPIKCSKELIFQVKRFKEEHLTMLSKKPHQRT